MNLIVAVDTRGGFGIKGTIPWRHHPVAKEDFKFFKDTTMGKSLLFGRKTYEEILELREARNKDGSTIDELLPGRKSYVLSRSPDLAVVGATKIKDITFMDGYHDDPGQRNLFICGGDKVYKQFLPFVQTAYVTIIKQPYKCDRFFPVEYLNNYFKIDSANETENAYYVKYVRCK